MKTIKLVQFGNSHHVGVVTQESNNQFAVSWLTGKTKSAWFYPEEINLIKELTASDLLEMLGIEGHEPLEYNGIIVSYDDIATLRGCIEQFEEVLQDFEDFASSGNFEVDSAPSINIFLENSEDYVTLSDLEDCQNWLLAIEEYKKAL